MKVKNIVYKNGYTKDGHLAPHQGRIVIYEDKALISRGNTPDHMYLLSALASKYHFKKDDVISNAIRLYYAIEDGVMIVSQNRRIDEDAIMKNLRFYGKVILASL